MLVNEWAWLRSQVCLLRLEVELGVVLESELGQKWEIRCIKGMYGLRVVSSEKKGFKGMQKPKKGAQCYQTDFP